MRSVIAVLLLCLIIAACSKKDGAHLPANKMEGLIMDIEMAETYSTMTKRDSTLPLSVRNTDSLAYYYKEIFAHHKVSAAEFQSSMTWYSAHPEQLDSIYVHISSRLTKLGAQYNVQ